MRGVTISAAETQGLAWDVAFTADKMIVLFVDGGIAVPSVCYSHFAVALQMQLEH